MGDRRAAGGPGWRRWPAILRDLSWADRLLLVETIVLVTVLPMVLRVVRVQRLVAAMDRTVQRRRSGPRVPLKNDRPAQRIARIVAMGARHTPSRTTCLHRSLALWWLLGRRGLESTLRLGARHHDGRLDAHAWVEHAGLVLNDDPEVARQYAPLPVDVRGSHPIASPISHQ